MTFDARGGSMSGGNSQNLVFGGVIVAIVGMAFGLTFVFSGGSDTQAVQTATLNVAETANTSLTNIYHSKQAKRYFEALRAVDSKAYSGLEKKLARTSRASDARKFEIVMEHGAAVLKDHSGALSHANVAHSDKLMDLTRASLKKAARSRSPWCEGSRYAGLSAMGPAQAKKLQAEFKQMGPAVEGFTFEAMTLMMLAITDGRANPVKYGKVTKSDEMALQGVIMSMMSDPQIMPLILAKQSGKSEEEILADLNICDLGATFLMAMKTLPQDTKGRVWAKAVREAELGGGNMGGFGL